MPNNVVYQYGNGLYINLTNKCPCKCSFCIRSRADGVGSACSLWLKKEPTAEQVISQLKFTELELYGEIVFCGFGEPLCALESLLEVCAYLRSRPDSPAIRINTNGLGDLINNKPTAPLLEGLVDTISISLNAPDRQAYNKLCRPSFGERSFDAILSFAQACKLYIPNVVFSVVDVLPEEALSQCYEIANSLDIPLRVRHGN